MTSFSVSNKPFITSMLLDEVQVLLFDFATSIKSGHEPAEVLRKFETHADIRAVLLATEEEPLVENAPRDYYWGCGADGGGQNKLGQVLMTVRAVLRSREVQQPELFSADHRT
jgi:predicted NAD-dependent protein-ADP-ribosyltransferase YbiA (DUF1768 family)